MKTDTTPFWLKALYTLAGAILLWQVFQAFLLSRYQITPWLQYVIGGTQS